jgi:hypothetical protein
MNNVFSDDKFATHTRHVDQPTYFTRRNSANNERGVF